MGVTSGSLLAPSHEGWREYRYDCVSCTLSGRETWQAVLFGPDDQPPATLRLPCFGAQLDRHAWLESAPLHLYRLTGPVKPADLE